MARNAPPADLARWHQRASRVDAIRRLWEEQDLQDGAEEARAWVESVDPTAYVGTRHHTVPRFLLARWADSKEQVRSYHRIEGKHRVENIRDLAIKDFYTFINLDGQKDSSFESILGRIEGRAKNTIDALLNPFRSAPITDVEQIAGLGMLAAFQATRTQRARREHELHGEWFAKTIASGKVPDAELQKLTVLPHQNHGVQFSMDAANNIAPFFVHRPLALVQLSGSKLYLSDEPVIVNAPPGDHHTRDCFLSDHQIAERGRRALKNMSKRKRKTASIPGRRTHFTSTRSTGYGVADEIVLPVSPSAALLWGPLEPYPYRGPIEKLVLRDSEALRFASMANKTLATQALDWIITQKINSAFEAELFPDMGPLLRVCDGVNAASIAANRTPTRFRPQRLTLPDRR